MARVRPAAVESRLIDLDNQARRAGIDDAPVSHKATCRGEIDLVTGFEGFSRQAEFRTGSEAGGQKGCGKGHEAK
ncbi:MAG: hypothetical protein JF571_03490 [Asticcacaulis sp.]|nr:hypothetical protein [Asticcacaulis sp.]